jgi:hypothetical protein
MGTALAEESGRPGTADMDRLVNPASVRLNHVRARGTAPATGASTPVTLTVRVIAPRDQPRAARTAADTAAAEVKGEDPSAVVRTSSR